MSDKLSQLPEAIKVKITRGKTGSYLAELPELDIFTEADSREDLIMMINDLIYTYFDVPKEFQGKIWYRPIQTNLLKVDILPSLKMSLTLTPDLYRSYFHE